MSARINGLILEANSRYFLVSESVLCFITDQNILALPETSTIRLLTGRSIYHRCHPSTEAVDRTTSCLQPTTACGLYWHRVCIRFGRQKGTMESTTGFWYSTVYSPPHLGSPYWHHGTDSQQVLSGNRKLCRNTKAKGMGNSGRGQVELYPQTGTQTVVNSIKWYRPTSCRSTTYQYYLSSQCDQSGSAQHVVQ